MNEKLITGIQILFYIILSIFIMIMIFFTGLGVEYLIQETNGNIQILDVIKIIVYFSTMVFIMKKIYKKGENLIGKFELYFIHKYSINNERIYFCINISKLNNMMDNETCECWLSDLYDTIKFLPITLYKYKIDYNEWNY